MDKPISMPRRQGCIYVLQEALKNYTALGVRGYNPHAEKGSKYVGTRHNLSPEIQTIYKSMNSNIHIFSLGSKICKLIIQW